MLDVGRRARTAARQVARADSATKNKALTLTAAAIERERARLIEANANDEGHLYGSVGATEISRSLKQQDLMVTSDQIILQGPLKEVGLYTVRVRLAAEVEGDLKVWVVPSSSETAAK